MQDAMAILRRRGAIAAAVTIALCLAAFFATRDHAGGTIPLLDSIASSAFALLAFAQAMRIVQPHYALDFGRIARLLWYAFLLGLMLLACLIPVVLVQVLLAPHARDAFLPLDIAALDCIWLFLSTRFAFLCFLCEDEGVRAFEFSWRLTSGTTFLSTLVAALLWFAPIEVCRYGSGALINAAPSAPWAALSVFLYLAVCFVVFAYAYPLMARWMIACRRFHPNVSLGLADAESI
jgi:hypothetical protein